MTETAPRKRWWKPGRSRHVRPVAVERIAPAVTVLLPELPELADAAGVLDAGIMAYLEQSLYEDWPELGTPEWVLAAVVSSPGLWTTKLCRALHGIPETVEGIGWCGRCTVYANPNKRARAQACPRRTLPGWERIGGAGQLHPPCGPYHQTSGDGQGQRRHLRWLRYRLQKLERQGLVYHRRERIPDLRQARGWDIATCWYPCIDVE